MKKLKYIDEIENIKSIVHSIANRIKPIKIYYATDTCKLDYYNCLNNIVVDMHFVEGVKNLLLVEANLDLLHNRYCKLHYNEDQYCLVLRVILVNIVDFANLNL